MEGALNQAFNMFKGVKDGVGAGLQNLSKNVGEFTYSPETLPQDWRYRTAKIGNEFRKNASNLLQIPFQKGPNELEKFQAQQYQQASPTGKLTIDAVLGEGSSEWEQTSGPSADYNRYYMRAPAQDKMGGELKAQILKDPRFLPGAKSYLETIPFSGENLYEMNAAGLSYNTPYGDEGFIQYDPRNAKRPEFANEVAAHELMHQAVNVFGEKELGSFIKDFAMAYQANPKKYAKVAAWIDGYRENKKDTNYFKNPLQEANELFAEIGALYGPDMAEDPLLGKYYQKVFTKGSQNTTANRIPVKKANAAPVRKRVK